MTGAPAGGVAGAEMPRAVASRLRRVVSHLRDERGGALQWVLSSDGRQGKPGAEVRDGVLEGLDASGCGQEGLASMVRRKACATVLDKQSNQARGRRALEGVAAEGGSQANHGGDARRVERVATVHGSVVRRVQLLVCHRGALDALLTVEPQVVGPACLRDDPGDSDGGLLVADVPVIAAVDENASVIGQPNGCAGNPGAEAGALGRAVELHPRDGAEAYGAALERAVREVSHVRQRLLTLSDAVVGFAGRGREVANDDGEGTVSVVVCVTR